MTFRGIARRLGLGRLRRWLAAGPGAGRSRTQRQYRRLHQVVLRGRGYGAGGWRESGEAALLKRLRRERPNISLIIDVGANVGGWAKEAARTWPQAQIHAFEPAAETFAELAAATHHLNVVSVNAALSDAPGEAILHSVTGESGLTSLYDRDLAVHGITMTAGESVRLIRLDDYAAENDIDHIDFLKIDAEGHDLAVIKGAANLIQRGAIDLIQFEFGGANIDSRTYLRDFVRFLEPQFRISRLLVDGLEPLVYGETEEVFVTCNFIAERRVAAHGE